MEHLFCKTMSLPYLDPYRALIFTILGPLSPRDMAMDCDICGTMPGPYLDYDEAIFIIAKVSSKPCPKDIFNWCLILGPCKDHI